MVVRQWYKHTVSSNTCPEMVGRQWYRHTMSREQLVQHSQFKQGKMPSTSSCPEMVVRQWYRGEQLVQHSQLRRTISAAQSVANRVRCQAQAHVQKWSSDSDTDTQWGEQLVQHSQFKQGKMPSTSSCPEMVVRQWYRHTWGEQLVQHSQLKQGKMPSTSPEMVVRQWYTHTVRRTISAAQSVQTG